MRLVRHALASGQRVPASPVLRPSPGTVHRQPSQLLLVSRSLITCLTIGVWTSALGKWQEESINLTRQNSFGTFLSFDMRGSEHMFEHIRWEFLLLLEMRNSYLNQNTSISCYLKYNLSQSGINFYLGNNPRQSITGGSETRPSNNRDTNTQYF